MKTGKIQHIEKSFNLLPANSLAHLRCICVALETAIILCRLILELLEQTSRSWTRHGLQLSQVKWGKNKRKVFTQVDERRQVISFKYKNRSRALPTIVCVLNSKSLLKKIHTYTRDATSIEERRKIFYLNFIHFPVLADDTGDSQTL